MSVITAQLPSHSLLHAYGTPDDFLDCYACKSTLDVDTATQIGLAFPAWARALLWLRNVIVAPLGLATTQPQEESINHFPIDQRNENEIILGFDDSHLDFRISILKYQNMAYGATWVHTNNWLGKAYLSVIMPFHVLIMRNAMRQIERRSSKKAGQSIP